MESSDYESDTDWSFEREDYSDCPTGNTGGHGEEPPVNDDVKEVINKMKKRMEKRKRDGELSERYDGGGCRKGKHNDNMWIWVFVIVIIILIIAFAAWRQRGHHRH